LYNLPGSEYFSRSEVGFGRREIPSSSATQNEGQNALAVFDDSPLNDEVARFPNKWPFLPEYELPNFCATTLSQPVRPTAQCRRQRHFTNPPEQQGEALWRRYFLDQSPQPQQKKKTISSCHLPPFNGHSRTFAMRYERGFRDRELKKASRELDRPQPWPYVCLSS